MGTRERAGFAALWVSAATANLADGILLAGLPVVATTVTDSPAAIAGVHIAVMLPLMLTALPAGVIADRHARHRIIQMGNLLRALTLAAVLALVTMVDVRLALVYATAALTASGEMLVDTTTRTAVPGLVPRRGLERANARLGGTQVLMNDAVGAPIGSLLAVAGAAALLGAPVLLYLVAGMAALRVRPRQGSPHDETPRSTSAVHEVREGIEYLLHHDVLRRIALVAATSNLGNTAFGAVFVVFVIGPLELPRASYGAFLAALAAGGLVGSLVADRVLRLIGRPAALKASFLVGIGSYAAVAVTSSAVVVAVAAAVLGAAAMVTNVAVKVLEQILVPDRLLGRVIATVSFIALIATPLGAALGGAVAELVGIRAAAWTAVAANLFALWLLRTVDAASVAATVAGRAPSPGAPAARP